MITLTDAASKKIQQSILNRSDIGIRIGVKTSGCSGMAYVLEYVDCPNPDDQCFECKGFKLFVDPKSLVYVDNLEIDYTKQGLNEGFEFTNPNERDRCGCGKSFRI